MTPRSGRRNHGSRTRITGCSTPQYVHPRAESSRQIKARRPCRRAIACKGQRQPRHSWQRWQCGICNLQNLKEPPESESHSLRQPSPHTPCARGCDWPPASGPTRRLSAVALGARRRTSTSCGNRPRQPVFAELANKRQIPWVRRFGGRSPGPGHARSPTATSKRNADPLLDGQAL